MANNTVTTMLRLRLRHTQYILPKGNNIGENQLEWENRASTHADTDQHVQVVDGTPGKGSGKTPNDRRKPKRSWSTTDCKARLQTRMSDRTSPIIDEDTRTEAAQVRNPLAFIWVRGLPSFGEHVICEFRARDRHAWVWRIPVVAVQ
jgi:hypothetical protein